MNIYTVDFETFFSDKYSLTVKELNTSSYIRHPEFKVQCVGIKKNDEETQWFEGIAIQFALKSIDWENSALLCHNAAFDGLILSHHFGIVPKFYLDTLSMARTLHSNAIGASLNEVAGYYKVGNKLPDVLNKTKGIRDLPPELMKALGAYCAMDVSLTKQIFDIMREGFPEQELTLIDMTVRMFADPILLVDIPRVEAELKRELEERKAHIEASGCDISILRSGNKFADELRGAGILPPTKISPTTGKTVWAFAKGDLDFIGLLEHPNVQVRNLVRARIAAKSTIGSTRAIRFLDAGRDSLRLPVGLKYWGAHTGRWSGSNKMNLQNLVRGGELRRSILAPPGYVIVVADSAQIEARVLAWFAGQADLITRFAEKQDVYKHMASVIYGIPIEDVNKEQRFVGKVAVLGLGYGMGADKFRLTLEVGAMGPSVILDEDVARRVVQTYRRANPYIVTLWARMERILAEMALGRSGSFGCIRYEGTKVFLPNGTYLQYPGLRFDWDPYNERATNFKYFTSIEDAVRARMTGDYSKGHGIYGGLFVENIIQALARAIIAEQMIKVAQKYRVVTMTHDEIVCLAKEEEADEALEYVIGCMRERPIWAKELPINCEGGYDHNYSK